VTTRRTEAVETPHGAVSVWWDLPVGRARWGMALAHGAGTRADHPSLARLGAALAEAGFAVCRFNFPYAEAGRKPPDRAPTLLAVWEAVWTWFSRRAEVKGLPRIAAGRSMGGRMASLAASTLDAAGEPRTGTAAGDPPGKPSASAGKPSAPAHVSRIDPDGLVFFAYPLYRAGRPERPRAAHLPGIEVPLLFVSGTRDAMAKPEHLDPVLSKLGNRATICWIAEADHGFKAPKRTGRTEAGIAAEAAEAAARWAAATFPAAQRGKTKP
jgi:predicted alpha/beta-hydrolase family hydrolase